MIQDQQASVGQLLIRAREVEGLTREALAKDLKLPLRHIEAIEADDWASLPPGRARPLARQLAERLGVDLEFHTGAFQIVPGVRELEPPDPRQEKLERIVMGLLTVASACLVVWLVVPGPRLGHKIAQSRQVGLAVATLPPPPAPSASPYPVLGELLPEAPLNPQGILVSLRAIDTCEVRLEPAGEPGGQPLARTLRVSEPWKLRIKGPFRLFIDNAGVVNVEVAGIGITHGGSVGEAWLGRFDEAGRWLRPAPPVIEEGAEMPDDDQDTNP